MRVAELNKHSGNMTRSLIAKVYDESHDGPEPKN